MSDVAGLRLPGHVVATLSAYADSGSSGGVAVLRQMRVARGLGPSLRGLPSAALSLLSRFAPAEAVAVRARRSAPAVVRPPAPVPLVEPAAETDGPAVEEIMFEIRMPFHREEREALTMHGSDLEARYSRDRSRHARDALAIALLFRARCGGASYEPAPLASLTADYLRPDESRLRASLDAVRLRLRPLLVPRWRWRAHSAADAPPLRRMLPHVAQRISRVVEDFLG